MKTLFVSVIAFVIVIANCKAQQMKSFLPQFHTMPVQKWMEEVVFQKGIDTSHDGFRRCPAVVMTNKATAILNCESRRSLSDADLVGRIFARKEKKSSCWTYNYLFPYDSVQLIKYMEGCFVVDRKGVVYEDGKKCKGRIYFFYLMMKKTVANGGYAMKVTVDEVSQGLFASRYVYSDDDGMTWSKEHTTPFDTTVWRLVFASPSNGIQMQDGTLVIPTWGIGQDGQMYSGLCYKRPKGDWTYSSRTFHAGDNESNVLEVGDSIKRGGKSGQGRILLLCRKRDERVPIKDKRRTVYVYDFETNGFTFLGEYPFNATCEMGTCQYRKGKQDVFLMSFTNNDLSDPNVGARKNGTLFSSEDGLHWKPRKLMRTKDNNFGYSGVDTNGKQLGFTYELNGKQIVFVGLQFPLSICPVGY